MMLVTTWTLRPRPTILTVLVGVTVPRMCSKAIEAELLLSLSGSSDG